MSASIPRLQALLTALKSDPTSSFFQDLIIKHSKDTIDTPTMQAIIKKIDEEYQTTTKVKEAELM